MDFYRKILVPLDGSPRSETALPVACDFALQFSAEIHLLVSYDINNALFLGSNVDSLPADFKKLKAHQRKQVEHYLLEKSAQVQARGISVHSAAMPEDARECICKYAGDKEIDVIIMNSGGRSGWMRWLTGSIAEEVLRHSPCPVLVLRETTTQSEESS